MKILLLINNKNMFKLQVSNSYDPPKNPPIMMMKTNIFKEKVRIQTSINP